MTDDVATVAAGLHWHDLECIATSGDRLEGSIATLLNLSLSGLASVERDNSVRLTPLGLSVRDHILKEQG